MISNILREARIYEELAGQTIPDGDRPAFHLSPRTGWMNDPNGFSFYQGKYHLFYQYYPYTSKWGPMHWGHAVSEDLLHWTHLPAALAPDTLPDRDGCFSGSAVELPDGRQLLMYTGVVSGPKLLDKTSKDTQTQCLAAGDGVDYEKYGGNPVLTAADLPEGGSPFDFRDPKMWREKDGTYRCVVGNRPADGSGQILYYSSEDGFRWKFESVLAENKNRFGLMWECPDFFELDEKYVLLTSPQDMLPSGFEYHNGNGTLCLIGDFDGKTFQEEHDQSIDYGIDFYAPQTLLTPDGRRVMIGWMQNWNTVGGKPRQCRWFGQMSIPRELTVKNGRLYQLPVRELDNYRGPCVSHHNIPVSGEVNLPGIQGRVLDMTVTVRPIGHDSYRWFRIHLAKDGQHDTVVRYRPEEGTVKIDRTRSGLPWDIVHTRSFFVGNREGEIKLRIVMDRFSLEVFVNDGEQAASAVIYTEQSADAITFEAGGSALMDVEKYDLLFD